MVTFGIRFSFSLVKLIMNYFILVTIKGTVMQIV